MCWAELRTNSGVTREGTAGIKGRWEEAMDGLDGKNMIFRYFQRDVAGP